MHALDRHPAGQIGRAGHLEPDLVIGDGPGACLGAVWSHHPVAAEVEGLAQHAVALHLGGCTLVEKWRDGRLVGHHARVGSVSLVPAQVRTQWVLSGHCRVAHLYVDPQRLAGLGDGRLRDFFAEDDEVAATLVRLAVAQARAGTLDLLAQDELAALMARHLVQRYAADRPLPPARTAGGLTAATLRRVFAHIDDGLSGALRLSELSALAHLSDDHFLRAFKAAVGQTPHQYVLTRRVAHAQHLLRRSAVPVTVVARRTGFRSASHFASVFRRLVGQTPSDWRDGR